MTGVSIAANGLRPLWILRLNRSMTERAVRRVFLGTRVKRPATRVRGENPSGGPGGRAAPAQGSVRLPAQGSVQRPAQGFVRLLHKGQIQACTKVCAGAAPPCRLYGATGRSLSRRMICWFLSRRPEPLEYVRTSTRHVLAERGRAAGGGLGGKEMRGWAAGRRGRRQSEWRPGAGSGERGGCPQSPRVFLGTRVRLPGTRAGGRNPSGGPRLAREDRRPFKGRVSLLAREERRALPCAAPAPCKVHSPPLPGAPSAPCKGRAAPFTVRAPVSPIQRACI
jgi:hypothetical protein